MKIQRAPLILFAIAALLGGFVYFYEIQGATKREQAQQQTKKLFPFEEKDVQAFTVKTTSQTLSFAKTSQSSASSAPTQSPTPSPTQASWRMTTPKTVAANEGSIAYLLNLLGTGNSEKTLTVPTARLAEFGFNQSPATVDVRLNNQKTHRLVLGKPDFNRTYLYAQIDPPDKPGQDATIHLVSLDFESAVTRPLQEWEAATKP